MGFLALTCMLALATAEEEKEAIEKIASGESCADNKTGCDAGLCCGEGVAEGDVVDGKVAENYLDNAVTVCFDEKAEEFENDDGKYYFSCLKVDGAAKLAAGLAMLSSAYLMA